VSSDHVLDLKLTMPRELGGSGNAGTNPEQLFAAGYSACFLNAMRFAGSQIKIAVPADAQVTATVGIGANDRSGPGRFALQVKLEVALPGVSAEIVNQLVQAADAACPYPNALRGNVDVEFSLV
jgi:Ohr subfamily peroxiredoxin